MTCHDHSQAHQPHEAQSLQATAFWSDHGRGELRTQTLPKPGINEALVRTHYTALSKGTESLVFEGRVPKSEYQRMRAPFQEGEFGGPVKYGYCNVGIVEAGPSDWLGERVFCLYPHQDRYVVPTDALRRLPQGLPLDRAVLAANMETAVNALADAGLDPELQTQGSQPVTLIGAGVVGCLVAFVAQHYGHEVEVIDIDEHKRSIVEGLGLRWGSPEKARSDRAVVIHTSATEAGLIQALNLAGPEGLIVEMSWFGTTRPCLPLGEAFHAKRLTLRSSQVSQIAPARKDSWDYARRFEHALAQLMDDRLDALMTHESPFQALPQVMANLTSTEGVLCHRIRYID